MNKTRGPNRPLVFAPRRWCRRRCTDRANKVDSSGDSCWHTTWQIDAKAGTITGSCFAYQNEHTSLKFDWTLKRIGGAPGG